MEEGEGPSSLTPLPSGLGGEADGLMEKPLTWRPAGLPGRPLFPFPLHGPPLGTSRFARDTGMLVSWQCPGQTNLQV